MLCHDIRAKRILFSLCFARSTAWLGEEALDEGSLFLVYFFQILGLQIIDSLKHYLTPPHFFFDKSISVTVCEEGNQNQRNEKPIYQSKTCNKSNDVA